MNSDNKSARHKAARGFPAMVATYFMGVFNDNFFKQAAKIIAVRAGLLNLQGYAAAVFTLPYLLFASQAGWMADRYSKRTVMICSKALELAAMLFGATGIYLENWNLIFAMLFIMGFQSCLFSPAINGSIPEVFSDRQVPKANALIKVTTTGAIFGGIAMAGIIRDTGLPFWGVSDGNTAIALIIVIVSVLGLCLSIGTPPGIAQAPEKPFPAFGFADTFRSIRLIFEDPLLRIAAISNAFLWFCGSLLTLVINPLGIDQYGLSDAVTGYLSVVLLAGIAVGGIIAGFARFGKYWHSPVPVATALLAFPLIIAGFIPGLDVDGDTQITIIFVLIALTGLCSGCILIPVESFIQIRPDADKKGEVIGAINFLIFSGILISGFISNALNAAARPTTSLALIGMLSAAAAVWQYLAFRRNPE